MSAKDLNVKIPRQKVLDNYKTFFGLEDCGTAEDDQLMIDWGVALLEDFACEGEKQPDTTSKCNKQNVNNSALPTLKEFALGNFDNVAEIAQRITTGNVAHHKNTIAGLAKRCSEFIRKHYC